MNAQTLFKMQLLIALYKLNCNTSMSIVEEVKGAQYASLFIKIDF